MTAAAAVSLLSATMPAGAAPEAELISFWDASDEANDEAIDHTLWQELLDTYLKADDPSGINSFDYATLKSNTNDRKKLSAYLKSLATIDPAHLFQDRTDGLLD